MAVPMDGVLIASGLILSSYMFYRLIRHPMYDILAQLRRLNTESYVIRRHLERRDVTLAPKIKRPPDEPVIISFPEDRICE